MEEQLSQKEIFKLIASAYKKYGVSGLVYMYKNWESDFDINTYVEGIELPIFLDSPVYETKSNGKARFLGFKEVQVGTELFTGTLMHIVKNNLDEDAYDYLVEHGAYVFPDDTFFDEKEVYDDYQKFLNDQEEADKKAFER